MYIVVKQVLLCTVSLSTLRYTKESKVAGHADKLKAVSACMTSLLKINQSFLITSCGKELAAVKRAEEEAMAAAL